MGFLQGGPPESEVGLQPGPTVAATAINLSLSCCHLSILGCDKEMRGRPCAIPPYQEGQPRLERRNGEGVFAKVVPARKGLLGN